MHSIRSRARHTAWKMDPDGKTTKWNPFVRTRSYTARSDEEAVLRPPERVHSEACAEDPMEKVRHPDQPEYPPPPRATTAPATDSAPNSAIVEHGQAPSFPPISEERRKEEETNSGDTMVETPAPETEGPRKRRFGIFKKRVKDGPELDQTKTSDSKKSHSKITLGSQLRAVLLPQWLTINWLLLLVPVGIALHFVKSVSGVVVFVINFLAIIPLAGVLSYATEEIALRVGETLGGLLNATFGNAVELIVSIIALAKDEVVIVQTSLIGSMLSNLLLVMGMCFFFGGIHRTEQFFNVTVAQTAASLLALAIGSVIIPTIFNSGTDSHEGEAPISRGTAIILLLVYGSYLFFQLKSHAAMYNEPSKKVEKRKSAKKDEGETIRAIAQLGAGTAASAGGQVNQSNLVSDTTENEKEQPQLTLIGALITLAASTVLVAFCAEFMVDGIQAVTCTGGVSQEFVGLILLPIVGNAAEHATAVTVAIKDKMDLAIGVAVGSSMQIALLVLPLMVVLGWIMGKEDMTLNFDNFQVAVLFVSILLVNYLIQDGKSHWLEGVLLMSLYVIISVSAWFYPVADSLCG